MAQRALPRPEMSLAPPAPLALAGTLAGPSALAGCDPNEGREPPDRDRFSACQPFPGVRIDEGTVVEYGSYRYDARLAGVGGDPWHGTASTFMPVLAAPTFSMDERQLFLLANVSIGVDQEAVLVGFRQGVKIGVEQTRAPNDEASFVEIEQTTPWWNFPDGNISWHLTVQRQLPLAIPPVATGLPPGFATSPYNPVPALLAITTVPRYIPPGKGIPPGDPIGTWGNFDTLLSPWTSQATLVGQGYRVPGPALLTFACSVRQTNPLRPGRAAPPAVRGDYLPPETLFGMDYPGARYTGVAGSVLVRFFPLSCAPGDCR